MKVKLNIKSSKSKYYFSLNKNKIYCVIGIDSDYYRIINDHDDPCLYPPYIFKIIDRTIPDDWIIEYGEDGEKYAYPPELNTPYFFEDYHDGKKEAIDIFWKYMKKAYAISNDKMR